MLRGKAPGGKLAPIPFEYLGPVKIKDGIYLGNEFAARDFDFVLFNKVNRIVNCSHKALQNSF